MLRRWQISWCYIYPLNFISTFIISCIFLNCDLSCFPMELCVFFKALAAYLLIHACTNHLYATGTQYFSHWFKPELNCNMGFLLQQWSFRPTGYIEILPIYSEVCNFYHSVQLEGNYHNFIFYYRRATKATWFRSADYHRDLHIHRRGYYCLFWCL